MRLGTNVAHTGEVVISNVSMERNFPQYPLSPAARRLRMLRARQEQTRRSPDDHATLLAEVLAHAGVEIVFDIHPHSCNIGVSLHQNGYRGRIVTIEPHRHAWEQLRYCSMADDGWMLSHSLISHHDGVILSSDEPLPLVSTRFESAVEVFCEEGETIAVCLSQADDGELLEEIIGCRYIRAISLACSVTEQIERAVTIESALAILRRSNYDVVAVHSRQVEENRTAGAIADVIAVRVPTGNW